MTAPRSRRKLTPDEVRAIRAREDGVKTLAVRFGVSVSTVTKIIRGERYVDVTDQLPPRRPTCDRTPSKRKFLTENDARRGRDRHRTPDAAARLEPYLCDGCGYWHLKTRREFRT